MFWHDDSTLTNHSHILMNFSAMHDPAASITDQKYFKNHKKSLNALAEVEKPHLYLMGMVPIKWSAIFRYWKFLLVVDWLLEIASEQFSTKSILAMCEIQKISYLPESKQNSKTIFCLSNIIFLHSMFLVINLQNNSKSPTQRKLLAAYSILFLDVQLTSTSIGYFLE